jgi:proline iminopeptidase
MAADSVAILDALGIARAHVVGASMGGMIAQLIAARHPERVLSLASIMSSSGAPHLPAARPDVLHALFRRPANPHNFDALVEHYVQLYKLIGSPGFPTPDDVARERVADSLKRSNYPVGTARQMVAVMASGDRSPELARIRCKSLVIHGTDDLLLPPAAGRDTAAKIPDCRLVLIPGMGHDLAPGLVPILAAELRDHFTPSSL